MKCQIKATSVAASLALSHSIAHTIPDTIPTLVTNLGQVHFENDTPEDPRQSITQGLEIHQSVKYC